MKLLKENFGYIYKITNIINNKIYIGKTKETIDSRYKRHIYDIEHHKTKSLLYDAMKKYGIDSFKVEQIDVATDQDELNKKEIYWISFYNSTDHEKGYNLTTGGEVKKEMSLESRKRMSESHKNKPSNRLGKHHTEETKKKISEAMTGKRIGKYNVCSIPVRCIETGEIFESIGEVERKYNIKATKVCAVCKGKRHMTGGFHWEYADNL